ILRRLSVNRALNVRRCDTIPCKNFVNSLRKTQLVVQRVPSEKWSRPYGKSRSGYLRPCSSNKLPQLRWCQNTLNMRSVGVEKISDSQDRLIWRQRKYWKCRPSRTNIRGTFSEQKILHVDEAEL